VLSYVLVLEEPDSEKLSTYECGYEPYDNSRHIFNIRFFLIAILFVIFDIEMLFLIPWCVSVAKLNLLGFWSVIDFIFELGVGFFYVWYMNSLDW
jgi:NADH-quinone oxidoreductase subunit A